MALPGDPALIPAAIAQRTWNVGCTTKFAWPIAETPSHWIILGIDKDLNTAMNIAARNAIDFLATRAKLTKLDAYGLLSIAASFRVTQLVDITGGIHCMIPKSLFAEGLRREITVV